MRIVDRALDMHSREITFAANAIRAPFRYRCRTCNQSVMPCLGKLRQYFRHEDGAPSCPEMSEEPGVGDAADARAGRMFRLLLDADGKTFSLKSADLHVGVLSADFGIRRVGWQDRKASSLVAPGVMVFTNTAFGGMQLADSTELYPGERYFIVYPTMMKDFPDVLRRAGAVQESAFESWVYEGRLYNDLFRLPLPKVWNPAVRDWFASIGLKPAAKPREVLRAEEDLPRAAEGVSLNALLSAPEAEGTYFSLFMGSATSARWTLASRVETALRRPKRIIEIQIRYPTTPEGEFYLRAESNAKVESEWIRRLDHDRPSFVLRIGDEVSVLGDIKVGVEAGSA